MADSKPEANQQTKNRASLTKIEIVTDPEAGQHSGQFTDGMIRPSARSPVRSPARSPAQKLSLQLDAQPAHNSPGLSPRSPCRPLSPHLGIVSKLYEEEGMSLFGRHFLYRVVISKSIFNFHPILQKFWSTNSPVLRNLIQNLLNKFSKRSIFINIRLAKVRIINRPIEKIHFHSLHQRKDHKWNGKKKTLLYIKGSLILILITIVFRRSTTITLSFSTLFGIIFLIISRSS